MTWTHREKCEDCDWRGYRSDLSERKPTAKEFKKHGGNKDKEYICCPKCKSFNVVGHEIDDDHLS